MLHALEDLDSLLHDGVRLPALQIDDETDTAGIVFVAGIV